MIAAARSNRNAARRVLTGCMSCSFTCVTRSGLGAQLRHSKQQDGLNGTPAWQQDKSAGYVVHPHEVSLRDFNRLLPDQALTQLSGSGDLLVLFRRHQAGPGAIGRSGSRMGASAGGTGVQQCRRLFKPRWHGTFVRDKRSHSTPVSSFMLRAIKLARAGCVRAVQSPPWNVRLPNFVMHVMRACPESFGEPFANRASGLALDVDRTCITPTR